MGSALRIVVTSGDAETFRGEVREFPVMLGRDPSCQVHLAVSYVSKMHAAIDLRDGRLLLRDLGARNPIVVAGASVPSNQEVELAPRGGSFSIGKLQIAVTLVDAEDVPPVVSIITGKPISQPPDGPAKVAPARAPAVAPVATSSDPQLGAHFDAYRRAWDAFARKLSEDVARLDPSARTAFLRAMADRYGAAAHEPEFRRLLEQHAIAAEPLGGKALEVLRMLAKWYLDLPLDSESDVEQFGLKLRKTLDEFLRAVLPMRGGLQASEQTVGAQGRRSPLDVLRTDAELADHLLNWKHRHEGARDLRRFFAGVRIHQIGLLNGVMHGVEALLGRLAPVSIETDLKEGRVKGAKPVLGLGLHRALWDEFCRRHEDLASEEGGRFSVVFGPECADSYRAIADELSPKTTSGAAVPPVPLGAPPFESGAPSLPWVVAKKDEDG